MRLGLRARFILLISIVLLCLFTAGAFLLIRNVQTSQVNDLNRESKAFAALATKPVGDTYTIYKESGSVRVQQEVQQFTDLDSNVSSVRIVGLDGQVLFPLPSSPSANVSAGLVETFTSSYSTNSSGLITRVIQPYFDDANEHPFSIVYTVSDTELAQNIAQQEIDIVVFSVIGLIASAVAAFQLISRVFLIPVERMSQTAMLISGGNYDRQMKGDRNDEIGDLARSVNQMTETLKSDIQKLQEVDRLKNEFIMITSHNLRTPLTIIDGNVDLLKTSKLDAQTSAMVAAIEDSSRNLGVFAEDMLTIASIENGAAVLSLKSTPLPNIFKGLQEEVNALAEDKKIHLNWQLEAGTVTIEASEVHLRDAIRDILDNAIKFNKEGGQVSVVAKQLDRHLVISVTDTGIGISPEELPKLFTKFHRGTSTLTYNYEGTGIGLYAAKLIVEAHHGTLEAHSEFGKSSTFTISLPVETPVPITTAKSE